MKFNHIKNLSSVKPRPHQKKKRGLRALGNYFIKPVATLER